MRHLSKKAICAFASAVMLCGSSAIPANAATKASKNISITNSRYGTSTGRDYLTERQLEKEVREMFQRLSEQLKDDTVSLNRSEVLLYEGETTTITVNVGSETDIAKGNGTIMYQWYNENGAIEGATASSYTTGALGTYYCEVWNTNISNLNWKLAETSLSAKKSTSFNADALRAENSVTLNDTTDSAKAVLSANVVNSSANKRSIGTMVSKKITPSEKVKTDSCVVKRSPLEITKQPQNGYICSEVQKCLLDVEVKGGKAPYTYTWTCDGNYFSIGKEAAAQNEGTYQCEITDANGATIKTNAVTVTKSILKLYNDYDFDKVFDTCGFSHNHIGNYTNVIGGTGKYNCKWYVKDGDEWRVKESFELKEGDNFSCNLSIDNTDPMSELIGVSAGESLQGLYCAWSGYAYYKLEIDTIDDNGNVVGNLTKNVTAIIYGNTTISCYY